MQYHKRSDAVKPKKPSSLGRFLPVMYQVLFFALFVAYLFGEYPAYLVTLCLFLFLWLMSNSCIHLEALKSLLPLNRPLIIASKCASKDAPENTMGAAKEVENDSFLSFLTCSLFLPHLDSPYLPGRHLLSA